MQQAILAVNLFDPFGRYQNMLARPPIAGVNDQVADRPVFVVDHEIGQMADRVITSLDVIAGKFLGIAEMRVVGDLPRSIEGVQPVHLPVDNRSRLQGCRSAQWHVSFAAGTFENLLPGKSGDRQAMISPVAMPNQFAEAA